MTQRRIFAERRAHSQRRGLDCAQRCAVGTNNACRARRLDPYPARRSSVKSVVRACVARMRVRRRAADSSNPNAAHVPPNGGGRPGGAANSSASSVGRPFGEEDVYGRLKFEKTFSRECVFQNAKRSSNGGKES
eukprot:6182791-Pleurochrysis_carterae.AAC.1